MSCNGCRVLRKGCSENCVLRPCLQWIQTPESQAYATVFVAKFFGRAGLMSFISAVPDNQRQSLFQSLLFEAAGRTVNPVNGAVGLLWTGNWHVCQASVETILRGGTLRPIPELLNGHPATPELGDSSETDVMCTDMFQLQDPITHSRSKVQKRRRSYEPQSSMTQLQDLDLNLNQSFLAKKGKPEKQRLGSPSMNSEDSVTTTCLDAVFRDYNHNPRGRGDGEPQILNLFN
ncbi:LOB domain-containing protein 37-like [Cynara cardunculus var. scolymus]|uniref:Lateral organ boundaries domain-containing protein n=1 Tax=Cynara cardunculus var. scolymus TaxID=59895 RepID=A0A103Y541_CYNCS|nr:LOB domain-containing protein 37-like [Cynara cardunculus var. scolymus]KVI02693.1 lateral organ boundaries domain-containing protein [Cynara cardunculus var. scolymus]